MNHIKYVVLALAIAMPSFAQEYKISTVKLNKNKTLTIKASVPVEKVGAEIAKILPAVQKYVKENKIKYLPYPFTRYFKYEPPANVDFEGGFVVAGDVKDAGDIKVGEIAETKALTTIHMGPYEKIGPAYEALHKYITDNKLEVNGGPIELYMNDPSQVKPEEIKTGIYFPIK